ncbi:PucR family transcriptional regulator ligand-binding domain-containing protein [Thermatribacter velox]|uniref:PucR family transcriptional regulator ligand-binding domain-containing protein n=1 Tax=Thermatribacter velox TaxID=3039681 RepID=A0ABZ2Y9V3_9BACT
MDEFKSARVVAGQGGLNRVIRWVHVVDVPAPADWVRGGELLFVTGIGLNKDPKSLCDLIEGLVAKNVAGLVINVGPYVRVLPSEVLHLADRLNFPILELPWEVKLVDVTEALCKRIVAEAIRDRAVLDLVETLINGRMISEEIVVNRARSYGFDFTRGYLVMVVGVDKGKEHLQKQDFVGREGDYFLKTTLQRLVVDICRREGAASLVAVKDEEVIVFLGYQEPARKDIRGIADKIRERVQAEEYGSTVSVGVSKLCQGLQDAARGYTEARRALFVCQCIFGGNTTLDYVQIGLYRVLFMVSDREELKSCFKDTLGRLAESDPHLLETLDAYLQYNGNLQRAAQQLFIHKNTLRYRLHRIEELTRMDLNNAHDRMTMATALAIGKFLKLY